MKKVLFITSLNSYILSTVAMLICGYFINEGLGSPLCLVVWMLSFFASALSLANFLITKKIYEKD